MVSEIDENVEKFTCYMHYILKAISLAKRMTSLTYVRGAHKVHAVKHTTIWFFGVSITVKD